MKKQELRKKSKYMAMLIQIESEKIKVGDSFIDAGFESYLRYFYGKSRPISEALKTIQETPANIFMINSPKIDKRRQKRYLNANRNKENYANLIQMPKGILIREHLTLTCHR